MVQCICKLSRLVLFGSCVGVCVVQCALWTHSRTPEIDWSERNFHSYDIIQLFECNKQHSTSTDGSRQTRALTHTHTQIYFASAQWQPNDRNGFEWNAFEYGAVKTCNVNVQNHLVTQLSTQLNPGEYLASTESSSDSVDIRASHCCQNRLHSILDAARWHNTNFLANHLMESFTSAQQPNLGCVDVRKIPIWNSISSENCIILEFSTESIRWHRVLNTAHRTPHTAHSLRRRRKADWMFFAEMVD